MKLFATIAVVAVLTGICVGAYLAASALADHLDDDQELAGAG